MNLFYSYYGLLTNLYLQKHIVPAGPVGLRYPWQVDHPQPGDVGCPYVKG